MPTFLDRQSSPLLTQNDGQPKPNVSSCVHTVGVTQSGLAVFQMPNSKIYRLRNDFFLPTTHASPQEEEKTADCYIDNGRENNFTVLLSIFKQIRKTIYSSRTHTHQTTLNFDLARPSNKKEK